MIPLQRAMELQKIDPLKAMSACGIDNNVLKDQESRLAAEKLSELLVYCNNQTGSHDFSVKVAEQFHPGMFHALGYAMMSSNTLKDAMARIAQYKRVVSNTCALSVVESDSTLGLEMSIFKFDGTNRQVLSLISVETFLATLTRFASELVGPELSLKKVAFSFPKPLYPIQYLTDFLKCEIVYDAEHSGIYFDANQANDKLAGGNPLITQAHEKMLDEFMSRIDKNDLTHVIKSKIYEVLPLGAPSQKEVAEQLGMSLRSLQRKLQEQGTSYKDILEQVRKKLTMEYIAQKHISLSEIGYLVGFSSVGNFNRAFKRWTECTPGEYRNNLLTE